MKEKRESEARLLIPVLLVHHNVISSILPSRRRFFDRFAAEEGIFERPLHLPCLVVYIHACTHVKKKRIRGAGIRDRQRFSMVALLPILALLKNVMARRTKEEAEKTRASILDAAEAVFLETGVVRATLQTIAEKANVTRGAVYWHFRDKIALLQAMANRVILPEEALLDDLARRESKTPLVDLEQVCVTSIKRILADPQHRRVLTILIQRCEYIDELAFMVDRQIESMDHIITRFARVFDRARRLGQLAKVWSPQTAAVALHGLLHGVIATDIKTGGHAPWNKASLGSLATLFATMRA
jgi:AcrR family transcriptional regulator